MIYRFKRTGPRVAAINWIVETSQVLKMQAKDVTSATGNPAGAFNSRYVQIVIVTRQC
jgi:hypothetical protein